MHSGKAHSRETDNALLAWRWSQISFTAENDRGVVKGISELELSVENVYLKRKRMFTRNQADRPNEDCGVGDCLHETKEKSGYAGTFFGLRGLQPGRAT